LVIAVVVGVALAAIGVAAFLLKRRR